MSSFRLYLAGLNVDISPLYPPVSYPVSRGTKSLAPLVRWEHSGHWRTGLEEFKDYSFTEKQYLITMNSEEFRNLVGHQVEGKIVMPIAAYLVSPGLPGSPIKQIDISIVYSCTFQSKLECLEDSLRLSRYFRNKNNILPFADVGDRRPKQCEASGKCSF